MMMKEATKELPLKKAERIHSPNVEEKVDLTGGLVNLPFNLATLRI